MERIEIIGGEDSGEVRVDGQLFFVEESRC